MGIRGAQLPRGRETSFHGQEVVRGYAECGVFEEAPPFPALVVINAHLVFPFLQGALDPLASLRYSPEGW